MYTGYSYNGLGLNMKETNRSKLRRSQASHAKFGVVRAISLRHYLVPAQKEQHTFVVRAHHTQREREREGQEASGCTRKKLFLFVLFCNFLATCTTMPGVRLAVFRVALLQASVTGCAVRRRITQSTGHRYSAQIHSSTRHKSRTLATPLGSRRNIR